MLELLVVAETLSDPVQVLEDDVRTVVSFAALVVEVVGVADESPR